MKNVEWFLGNGGLKKKTVDYGLWIVLLKSFYLRYNNSMKKINFENKWVVVTGASSGLGREIALYLSKIEKANVFIIARRTERLEILKDEIESTTNSKVKLFTSDLSKDGAGKELFEYCTGEEEIYAIINNAGLTAYEVASASNMKTYEKIINLNYKTVVETSLLFLEYFKKRGGGGIMNISSMAGLMPLPYQAIYSSSKHGLSGFTLALIGENIKNNVNITLFSPGGIKTEMVKSSGLEDKFGENNIFNMAASRVAKIAIIAFKKAKVHVIPGLMNKIADIMQRLLPKRVIASMFEKSYRPIKIKNKNF